MTAKARVAALVEAPRHTRPHYILLHLLYKAAYMEHWEPGGTRIVAHGHPASQQCQPTWRAGHELLKAVDCYT